MRFVHVHRLERQVEIKIEIEIEVKVKTEMENEGKNKGKHHDLSRPQRVVDETILNGRTVEVKRLL